MRYTEGYLRGLQRRSQSLDFSFFDGATILITGASGLVGSALADLLLYAKSALGLNVKLELAGRSETRISKRFGYWGDQAYSFVHYEASEPVAFAFDADLIFHCASNAHPKAYVERPVETLTNNVIGTANMLAYANKVSARRLLYVSSSEVYGRREGMDLYREEDQYFVDLLDPRSCYPSSKRSCETLCASYRAEYGVDSVITRPGHVWGPMATPSDSRAHAEFAREAAAGRNIVMKSAGSQLRSYIYAVDCAAALLILMSKGTSCEAYNVGVPGFSCTIRQLADALAAAGGVEIERDFPTEEEAAGYNPMSCSALDCSKLANLGFEAAFTLDEAARQTVECMRV